METARRYVQLRQKGLSHKEASRLSGWTLSESLKGAFWTALFFIGLLYWTSYEHKVEAKAQETYLKSMEVLLDGCTSYKGTTIQIGDEVYVCRSLRI